MSKYWYFAILIKSWSCDDVKCLNIDILQNWSDLGHVDRKNTKWSKLAKKEPVQHHDQLIPCGAEAGEELVFLKIEWVMALLFFGLHIAGVTIAVVGVLSSLSLLLSIPPQLGFVISVQTGPWGSKGAIISSPCGIS